MSYTIRTLVRIELVHLGMMYHPQENLGTPCCHVFVYGIF